MKKKTIISVVTLLSLGLGFLFGFVAPGFSLKIKFIGDWYIKLLKIIISPVIFVSMSLSVLNRQEKKTFLIIKTVGFFVLMFVVTFLMMSLVVYIFKPGVNFVVDTPSDTTSSADFTIKSILRNLLPTDVEGFFLGKNIFFVIIVALLSSFIVSKTKGRIGYSKGLGYCKKVLDFVLQIIIYLTPLGVLSLVSNMVVSYGSMIVTVGLKYILFAYIGTILTIILIMVIPVWIIAKVNPITYIRKVAKVWLVSLSTCSSVATLPYTIKCCNEDFGVDEKITDVVVPLGCTIHMCGGAVSFALLGQFVAQMSGVNIGFGTYMLMILFATLINMAAPGIPGGGVIIGLTYLSILNLPINGFYGFYSGIYKILDMPYTTLNVTGDISANILLSHFENKKNEQEKKSV